MKNVIYPIFLTILFVCGLQAQTTENLNWSRLESDSKDFSIAIPQNYQVIYDEKGYDGYYGSLSLKRKIKLSNIRSVTAFENNSTFLVESYKIVNLPDSLASLYPSTSNQKVAEISFNEFTGKVFTRETADFYSMEIIIGIKDRIYRIFGGVRNQTNETFQYFFASLKLNDKKLFAPQTPLDGKIKETSKLFSSLKETPFSVEKEKKEDSKQTDTNEQTQDTLTENVKRLSILYRPTARFTESARNSQTHGKFRLKIVFSGTGNIEKITILSGLSDGLTESAIRAARLIRFLPLEVNNKPTTITKMVEYVFTIY